MAKFVTFFNHKGGVGKTTLAYNVSWGLATEGKRVLMLDCDAQCNLTEITLGINDLEDEAIFEQSNNVYEYFLQYVQPKPGQQLKDAEPMDKLLNLKILTGSLNFSELESPMTMAVAGVPAMTDIPANLYEALKKVGEGYDFVIIDLSPALSATNQLLLMLSDYFIVPVNPSIFSRQALSNLGQIFRMWNGQLAGNKLFAKRIKTLPKMLGIVCQNYRPYSRKDEENTKSALRFSERIAELNSYAVTLANDLNSFGMALTPDEFRQVFENSEPYRVASIPDYNQLGVVSEGERLPVISIEDRMLNRYKLATPHYKQKIIDFKAECGKIIHGLLNLG